MNAILEICLNNSKNINNQLEYNVKNSYLILYLIALIK